MSKVPKKGYLDFAAKLKKHTLGPAHYNKKSLDNAINRLSVSPPSLRIRRH